MNNLISATARVEQNHAYNGSERRAGFDPMFIPDKEVEAGTKEGEVVSALAFVSPLAYKIIINLDEKKVTQDMMQNLDPKLRVTRGMFMIKYIPKTDKNRKKGRPWRIGQDLIRMQIYVSGPIHWNALCDKIPELDWIRKNSIMDNDQRKIKTLFDLAAQHPGITFWFCIDWFKYNEKLKANSANEPKTETDTTAPFGAYKCSAEEYRKHYKDKLATLRVLSDVLQDVQAVEMSPSVQSEMLKATGETSITREMYIKGHGHNYNIGQPQDPITGRFIKRKKE